MCTTKDSQYMLDHMFVDNSFSKENAIEKHNNNESKWGNGQLA